MLGTLGNSSELQTALSLLPWPSPSPTWKLTTPVRTLTRTTQRRHLFDECDFNTWPSYWGSCHITSNEIKHCLHQKSQTTNFSPLPTCEQIKLLKNSDTRDQCFPYGCLDPFNSLIEVYLRFQRHAFPQQKHDILNALSKALKSGSKKGMRERPRPQGSCKRGATESRSFNFSWGVHVWSCSALGRELLYSSCL